ncbi:BQ2448_3018 [Microbotryum intermedium]|uniref:BQ2448_3018 protein n=1 Tax=Microbotryum intermedium TaxID=269621 RepID=A0A238FC69_9BASI|nr:BQ2448_3018 [Microbotryum intermedium]
MTSSSPIPISGRSTTHVSTRSSVAAARAANGGTGASHSGTNPTSTWTSNPTSSSPNRHLQSPTKRSLTHVSPPPPSSSSRMLPDYHEPTGSSNDGETRVLRQKLSTTSVRDQGDEDDDVGGGGYGEFGHASGLQTKAPTLSRIDFTNRSTETNGFEPSDISVETSSTPVGDQDVAHSPSSTTRARLTASPGASAPSAEEQQTHFNRMPHDLNQALARLSSQHVLSEYNVLKRTVAAFSAPSANPPPLSHLHHHQASRSTQSATLTRSFSSPPSTSIASMSPTLYARPSSIAAPVGIATRGPWSRLTTFAAPARPELTRAATTSHWSSSSIQQDSHISIDGGYATSQTRYEQVTANNPATAPQSSRVTGLGLAASDMAQTTRNAAAKRVNHERCPTPTITSPPESRELRLDRSIVQQATILPDEELPLPALPSMPPSVGDGLMPGMRMINGVAVKTSVSHPMNISALIPPEAIPSLATSIFGQPMPSTKSRSPLTPSSSLRINSKPCESVTPPFILELPSNGDFWRWVIHGPGAVSSAASTGHGHPSPTENKKSALGLISPDPRLGNFMLSSCPGKKVRMDGVAQGSGGRSAICRDVVLDLQRAKDEGVGIVICCLDDAELAFLGSPWNEYSRACDELGLSVIRIPMIEGFAPSSPESLDAQLGRIIRDHTLRGESVLAHCRGGIGRAGLVATCWMLKMGFISGDAKRFEESDPMSIVEKVIEVVRKRRSIKSIETPIQVAFLLDYVLYLQKEAVVVRAQAL